MSEKSYDICILEGKSEEIETEHLRSEHKRLGGG